MVGNLNGIEIVANGAKIGADVLGVDLMNFDDGAFEVIRRAALEHMVLRFRGQSLSDPGLIAFGQRFGDLLLPGMSITGKHYIDEHPEILCVSNIRDE